MFYPFSSHPKPIFTIDIKPIFEPKADRFERQLQYTEALKKATQLQMKQYMIEAQKEWYVRVVPLMQAFRRELIPDDKDKLFKRYYQEFNEIIKIYIGDCQGSIKQRLKEHVKTHLVNDRALPITDETIRPALLINFMGELTSWISKMGKGIIFNNKQLTSSNLCDSLITEHRCLEEVYNDTFMTHKGYAVLIEAIDRLNEEENHPLLRTADKVIQELDKKLHTERQSTMDNKEYQYNAGDLLKIEVKSRTFDEYKNLFTDFMRFLHQNPAYSKEYAKNLFLQRAIAIIERYTQLEKLRKEHWGWWAWSYIKDKEVIKEKRYGEIEMMLLSLDLSIDGRIAQEQINNLLKRLATQAQRRGIYPLGGGSRLHDEFNKLLDDIHRQQQITSFSDVAKLMQDRLEKLEQKQAEQNKQNAIRDQLIAVLLEHNGLMGNLPVSNKGSEQETALAITNSTTDIFQPNQQRDGLFNQATIAITSQNSTAKPILSRLGLFRGHSTDTIVKTLFKYGLPKDVKLGTSLGDGDCFFDSVAQSLTDIGKGNYSAEDLRTLCHGYVVELHNGPRKDNWIYHHFLRDAEKQYPQDESTAIQVAANNYNHYQANISFTATDIKNGKGLNINSALWGEQNIDGRIISERLGVSLHVIEVHDNDGEIIFAHQLANKSVDDKRINYETIDTVHIAVFRHHFVPVLTQSMVKQSPRQTDGTEVIEQELNDIPFHHFRLGA